MKKKIGIIFIILSILITLFILRQSSLNATDSGANSEFILELLYKLFNLTIENGEHIIRKIAHFIEFMAQSFCVTFAFICFEKKYLHNLMNFSFIGLFTAVIDEFSQLFVDGRSGEVKDVLIDFSGTICGILIVFFVILIVNYIKKEIIFLLK